MSNNDKPKQIASSGAGPSSTGVRTLSDTQSVAGNEIIRVVVTAQTIDNGQNVTSSTYSGTSTGTANTSFSPTGSQQNTVTDKSVGTYSPTQPLGPLLPIHHADTLEPSSDSNYAGPTSMGDNDDEIGVADVFASSRENGTHEKNIPLKNNDKWVTSGQGQFVDVNFGAKATVNSVKVTGHGLAEVHDANDNPVATLNLQGSNKYDFKEPVQTGKLIFVNATPGKLEISHISASGSVEQRPDQKDSKKMASSMPANDSAIAEDATGSSDADTDTGLDDAAEENDETNSDNTGVDNTTDLTDSPDDTSSDSGGPMYSKTSRKSRKK